MKNLEENECFEIGTQTRESESFDEQTQTEEKMFEFGETEINEKGEIYPKHNENIIKIKFSHEIKTGTK